MSCGYSTDASWKFEETEHSLEKRFRTAFALCLTSIDLHFSDKTSVYRTVMTVVGDWLSCLGNARNLLHLRLAWDFHASTGMDENCLELLDRCVWPKLKTFALERLDWYGKGEWAIDMLADEQVKIFGTTDFVMDLLSRYQQSLQSLSLRNFGLADLVHQIADEWQVPQSIQPLTERVPSLSLAHFGVIVNIYPEHTYDPSLREMQTAMHHCANAFGIPGTPRKGPVREKTVMYDFRPALLRGMSRGPVQYVPKDPYADQSNDASEDYGYEDDLYQEGVSYFSGDDGSYDDGDEGTECDSRALS